MTASPHRRRGAWLGLAAVLAACGGGATTRPLAVADAPALVPIIAAASPPSPASAIPVPPTTSNPPPLVLPIPVDAPVDPTAPEPDTRLGTIDIPKLGLHLVFREGIRLTTIDKGPGHWPGTALPGQIGNAVIAGHRVSHTRPFRNIDRLQPGDQVRFTTNEGHQSVYAVTGTEIVTPDAMWIVQQTSTPTATLFACHPPGSATERYVVHLALVAPPAR